MKIHSQSEELIDEAVIRGEAAIEILRRIHFEIIEIKTRGDRAAHQRPAADRSRGLDHAGRNHRLGEFAFEDAGAERHQLVPILSQKMKLKGRTPIMMPLLIGLDRMPRAVGGRGEQEVDRGTRRSSPRASLNLLHGSVDLAVEATLRMRLKIQFLDHPRGV